MGAITLIMAVAGMAGTSGAVDRNEMPVSELTIESGQDRYVFRVEHAGTPGQQRQGLKNRDTLEPDAGMLFMFAPPTRITMWMKDTRLPLDILFINSTGIITQIVEQATPLSVKLIHSDTTVSAVLEVNGGTSARLGFRPGDRVIHPALHGSGNNAGRYPE